MTGANKTLQISIHESADKYLNLFDENYISRVLT